MVFFLNKTFRQEICIRSFLYILILGVNLLSFKMTMFKQIRKYLSKVIRHYVMTNFNICRDHFHHSTI